MKNLKLMAIALSTLFISCNDDDVKAVNEEEVITTVIVTLTGGGQVVTLTSRDLDGDGPQAPTVTVSGNLSANTTYTGSVGFFNELETPVGNITLEVVEEGADHQVFYQALPTALGTFVYTDTDANGKPIGVSFELLTGDAQSGQMVVTLRHDLNKSANGVATGDITNAGGSTDAQVTYPIVIE